MTNEKDGNAVPVEDIMAYESGDLSDDKTLEMFQELVNSGLAWQLQGSYGRMAQALIDHGLIQPAGK